MAHCKDNNGFTLIEVLIALAIISISLTAIFKSVSQNISITKRLEDKTIAHWVATQGVNLAQCGLLNIEINEEITKATVMLGQKWFWRAKITPTDMPDVQKIVITVSDKQTGPFTNPLIAFRYKRQYEN